MLKPGAGDTPDFKSDEKDIFGFEILDFGTLLGKKILASIVLNSLILVGFRCNGY